MAREQLYKVTVMPTDPADGSAAALTATATATPTSTGCKVPLRSSTVSVVTKPDRPQHLSQVLAALAVSLGPFAAGLGKGYSSPAIASLEQQGALFPVSAQQTSWVASLSLLGALCGGLLGGLAMRFGRRRLLLATALPLSACWVATVFATSVEMMFATAFFGGFCYAIVLVVTQVYISEISVPDIRGCLSALQKTVGHAGTLTSFAVGAYLDWRQLAAVVAAAPLLLFAAALCVPETPSFLVVAGRDAEALAALRWLRGPGADVRRELATLRGNVLARRGDPAEAGRAGGRLGALKRCPPPPGLLRPTLTTCGLMLFQRFSGAHAFSFYAVPILRQTLGGMDPHGGAVAVALVQLLASLLSGLLIDTAGRLPLLLASSTLMSMALAGFGSFAYYEDLHPQAAPHLDWIPLLCVLVFTVAFSLGISPISWLLIGELFPLEHRELGSAIATAFSYVCAFVGVKTFVDFQQALGLHGAFWLYAAVSLAGLCFVVCCVPETKGRDLDEMHPKGASA
ncbi:facilitated trehalose transporter Tret1-2 homolog [Schistocerca nitens]|uniref:facilitated trehalose transporter Tret1-2 homolog n=1 Tax=Schistocerca nitens TaxID=7011 RepID=UPI002118EC63|nr:facilitated trehalose transporter Tret1-2 homolog [Schistocerca nitens]